MIDVLPTNILNCLFGFDSLYWLVLQTTVGVVILDCKNSQFLHNIYSEKSGSLAKRQSARFWDGPARTEKGECFRLASLMQNDLSLSQVSPSLQVEACARYSIASRTIDSLFSCQGGKVNHSRDRARLRGPLAVRSPLRTLRKASYFERGKRSPQNERKHRKGFKQKNDFFTLSTLMA